LKFPARLSANGRKRVQDALRFAALTGVYPMIEKFPLEKAGQAYARMLSGRAEFRVVLTM
jgi:D-arabinose 1-dehydrogenase-like Zn-dependent alcohol dehydrogenase